MKKSRVLGMINFRWDKKAVLPKGELIDLISVSYFRMKRGYKSFAQYQDGLRHILQEMPVRFRNAVLRIYYDDSVADDPVIEEARHHTFTELVHFDCSLFREPEGGHIGTFGTIIRMVPMFEQMPQVRIVMVGDVDRQNLSTQLRTWEHMIETLHTSPTIKVTFVVRNCAQLQDRIIKVTKSLDVPITPFLYAFGSSVRFPKTLFEQFLQCATDPSPDAVCDYVHAFVVRTNHRALLQWRRMGAVSSGAGMYGIDEVLLARIVRYVLDEKIPYTKVVYSNFSSVFYPYVKSPSLLQSSRVREMIIRIMGDRYDASIDIGANFTKMMRVLKDFTYTNQETKSELSYYQSRVIDELSRIVDHATLYGLQRVQVLCTLSQRQLNSSGTASPVRRWSKSKSKSKSKRRHHSSMPVLRSSSISNEDSKIQLSRKNRRADY
jgi:hypothetical protein